MMAFLSGLGSLAADGVRYTPVQRHRYLIVTRRRTTTEERSNEKRIAEISE